LKSIQVRFVISERECVRGSASVCVCARWRECVYAHVRVCVCVREQQ